jgi:nucleotide-binding universal stress UspA family protein
MTAVLLIVVALGVGALAGWVLPRREELTARLGRALGGGRDQRLEPGPERILFPFAGRALSRRALDAALRLCRAEGATLVPAYLARVPLTLPMESPLPRQSREALPILEAIEQRAQKAGVPVDARIERGRTLRHAVLQLVEHERFDRIVTSAATGNNGSDGFSADDIAWLLDHAPGEIVVLHPGQPQNSLT